MTGGAYKFHIHRAYIIYACSISARARAYTARDKRPARKWRSGHARLRGSASTTLAHNTIAIQKTKILNLTLCDIIWSYPKLHMVTWNRRLLEF